MNNPIIGIAEQVYHEEQGYKFCGEIKIECLGCDKPAVNLLIVKRDENLPDWVFQIKCKKCGQLSFKHRVLCSKTYYQAIPPFSLSNIDVNLEAAHTLLEVQ